MSRSLLRPSRSCLVFLPPSKLVQQIIRITVYLLFAMYLRALLGLLWLDSRLFSVQTLQSVRHIALSVCERMIGCLSSPAADTTDGVASHQGMHVCQNGRMQLQKVRSLDDLKVSYSPVYVFSFSSNSSKGERADQWTGCGWTSPLAQPLAGLFRAPGSGVSHCRFRRQPR